MPHIMYTQIEPRKWLKVVFADQCDKKVYLGRHKCQGVKGHEGDHWAYDESGHYLTTRNEDDKNPPPWACGSCPPGHKDYTSPVDKYKERYLCYNEKSEVVDEDLIDKLENDEDLGEDVSIDKAVDDLDLNAPDPEHEGKTLGEVLKERMDDYDEQITIYEANKDKE